MATVSVKMLKTQKGSEDGFTVRVFEEGRIYPIDEWLAGVFIENKWAEPATGRVRAAGEPSDDASSAEGAAGGDEDTGEGGTEDSSTPAGNDEAGTPLLDQKPSQWVGKTIINPAGEERTVEKVNGNQVFFIEEDQSTDYRAVRRDYKAKE